jgi:hypothetical protein
MSSFQAVIARRLVTENNARLQQLTEGVYVIVNVGMKCRELNTPYVTIGDLGDYSKGGETSGSLGEEFHPPVVSKAS